MDPSPDRQPPKTPWWRVPTMWLVVGGPLVVVIAGFATLAIAILHPDPPVPGPHAPAAHATAPVTHTAAVDR
jgi:hypothetical protein